MAEYHRFHAAGHISAANIAVGAVEEFCALPNVSAPPQVRAKVKQIRDDLTMLEGWFVSDFNTAIERSGS